MSSLFAHHAYLPQGWTSNVRLHWSDNGDLGQIELDAQLRAHENQAQFVVPGMTNLHSHAFQRA
ncbi:MAG: formimidoylglutamate deiminase, partial [Burkholderiales bacterium]|nr:formimidoylglutamate deiminase [Burkholderiales bacterium]